MREETLECFKPTQIKNKEKGLSIYISKLNELISIAASPLQT